MKWVTQGGEKGAGRPAGAAGGEQKQDCGERSWKRPQQKSDDGRRSRRRRFYTPRKGVRNEDIL